jgi:hypothetical protein
VVIAALRREVRRATVMFWDVIYASDSFINFFVGNKEESYGLRSNPDAGYNRKKRFDLAEGLPLQPVP